MSPTAVPLCSAADVAAHIDQAGGIHLHLGATGWRLTLWETSKCGTSDCFTMRLKNVREETETPP